MNRDAETLGLLAAGYEVIPPEGREALIPPEDREPLKEFLTDAIERLLDQREEYAPDLKEWVMPSEAALQIAAARRLLEKLEAQP